MFAVQFGVTADYAFGQALFAVAMLALLAIKNTLSIWMKSAIILGYHGGCRVLKKRVHVKKCLCLSGPSSVAHGKLCAVRLRRSAVVGVFLGAGMQRQG
jgi:hypothetical protein